MTPAMKKMIFPLAATLLLTGCFHEFHEKAAGTGTVALALQWEQPEDAATLIHSLTCSVAGMTRRYRSVEEASADPLQLPAGEYDILVTANMTEEDGFQLSGLPPPKADGTLPRVGVALKGPASSPAQAWFGMAHASVTQGGISLVQPRLQRLLSTLSVQMANLPDGTAMTLTLSNVAREVDLTATDGQGRYGVPGSETAGDIPLTGGEINLLPTASGQDRCLLTLSLVSSDGNPLTVVCDAPRTDPGKSYTLELDYTHLKPYLYISSSSISPWQDGWAVSGEILNPV